MEYMEKRRSTTFDFEVLLQCYSAAELLQKEVFSTLDPDKQSEVLSICGADPNDPEALTKASEKLNYQLVSLNKSLRDNLF